MITETTSCKREIFFYENDDHETYGVPAPPSNN